MLSVQTSIKGQGAACCALEDDAYDAGGTRCLDASLQNQHPSEQEAAAAGPTPAAGFQSLNLASLSRIFLLPANGSLALCNLRIEGAVLPRTFPLPAASFLALSAFNLTAALYGRVRGQPPPLQLSNLVIVTPSCPALSLHQAFACNLSPSSNFTVTPTSLVVHRFTTPSASFSNVTLTCTAAATAPAAATAAAPFPCLAGKAFSGAELLGAIMTFETQAAAVLTQQANSPGAQLTPAYLYLERNISLDDPSVTQQRATTVVTLTAVRLVLSGLSPGATVLDLRNMAGLVTIKLGASVRLVNLTIRNPPLGSLPIGADYYTGVLRIFLWTFSFKRRIFGYPDAPFLTAASINIELPREELALWIYDALGPDAVPEELQADLCAWGAVRDLDFGNTQAQAIVGPGRRPWLQLKQVIGVGPWYYQDTSLVLDNGTRWWWCSSNDSNAVVTGLSSNSSQVAFPAGTMADTEVLAMAASCSTHRFYSTRVRVSLCLYTPEGVCGGPMVNFGYIRNMRGNAPPGFFGTGQFASVAPYAMWTLRGEETDEAVTTLTYPVPNRDGWWVAALPLTRPSTIMGSFITAVVLDVSLLPGAFELANASSGSFNASLTIRATVLVNLPPAGDFPVAKVLPNTVARPPWPFVAPPASPPRAPQQQVQETTVVYSSSSGPTQGLVPTLTNFTSCLWTLNFDRRAALLRNEALAFSTDNGGASAANAAIDPRRPMGLPYVFLDSVVVVIPQPELDVLVWVWATNSTAAAVDPSLVDQLARMLSGSRLSEASAVAMARSAAENTTISTLLFDQLWWCALEGYNVTLTSQLPQQVQDQVTLTSLQLDLPVDQHVLLLGVMPVPPSQQPTHPILSSPPPLLALPAQPAVPLTPPGIHGPPPPPMPYSRPPPPAAPVETTQSAGGGLPRQSPPARLADPSQSKQKKSQDMDIAAGAVAGSIGVTTVVLLMYVLWRKRQRHLKQQLGTGMEVGGFNAADGVAGQGDGVASVRSIHLGESPCRGAIGNGDNNMSEIDGGGSMFAPGDEGRSSATGFPSSAGGSRASVTPTSSIKSPSDGTVIPRGVSDRTVIPRGSTHKSAVRSGLLAVYQRFHFLTLRAAAGGLHHRSEVGNRAPSQTAETSAGRTSDRSAGEADAMAILPLQAPAVGGSTVPAAASAGMELGSGPYTGVGVDSSQQQFDLVLTISGELGRGAQGVVYRGVWRGLDVAVKSRLLQSAPGGEPQQQQQGALSAAHGFPPDVTHPRRTIQEAAISASVSHPNVVATYTYMLQRLEDTPQGNDPAPSSTGEQAMQGASTVASTHQQGARISPQPAAGAAELEVWKLTLVQELCDGNSLRHCLERGTLAGCRAVDSPSSRVDGIWTSVVVPASLAGGGGQQLAPSADTGSQLQERSSSSGPQLEARVMLVVALQVARGLAHLHSSAIVHADISSANILLKSCLPNSPACANQDAAAAADPCWYGYVAKVCDFGLSGKLDETREASHLSGPVRAVSAYSAPELVRHGHASSAGDVYAFAVVLWELALGCPLPALLARPEGARLQTWLVQQSRMDPMAVEALPPGLLAWPDGVPPGVVELVGRCLRGEPSARPSAQQLCDRLHGLLVGDDEPPPHHMQHQQQQQHPPAGPPDDEGNTARSAGPAGTSSLPAAAAGLTVNTLNWI